jgi:hypothetical protein
MQLTWIRPRQEGRRDGYIALTASQRVSICTRRYDSVVWPSCSDGRTQLNPSHCQLSVTSGAAGSSHTKSRERADESWWRNSCDGPRRRARSRSRSRRACGRLRSPVLGSANLRVRVSVRCCARRNAERKERRRKADGEARRTKRRPSERLDGRTRWCSRT